MYLLIFAFSVHLNPCVVYLSAACSNIHSIKAGEHITNVHELLCIQ